MTKVIVGQDAGLMINPDGVRHQIHGNVIQSTSRVLKEQVTFARGAVASREWGAYPILTFPEVPAIDVLMMDRPDEPPLGAGESASVPSAAAIANAIFDATGLRFRELPLTPERILAGLAASAAAAAPAPRSSRRRWGLWSVAAAAVTAAAGLIVTALPLRSAYAPIERPDAGVYAAATLARGRRVAAIGACNVCHVGATRDARGRAFAGGRALATPFGTVYATNITPDPDAGIGRWSYPAFERAMREGVHRDGHHLYPAHPYPSFTKASEADLEALYAYLMAQTAVATAVPATALRFPFSQRPLMAAWNALFLRPGAVTADPARSAAWNRGAYLVDGLGHCGACHTPRNALGAERRRKSLAGGSADGWDAPALDGTGPAPIPWDQAALYDYLRHGHAAHHGAAAGPMADVVSALAPLPDEDIAAMATYLASLSSGALSPAVAAERAQSLAQAAEAAPGPLRGARLFGGACAICHAGSGSATSLALSTTLHAARPDNAIQAILNGIAARPFGPTQGAGEGAMPGFRDSLSDAQVADLAAYLRTRFAPGRPAWGALDDAVAHIRSLEPHA